MGSPAAFTIRWPSQDFSLATTRKMCRRGLIVGTTCGLVTAGSAISTRHLVGCRRVDDRGRGAGGVGGGGERAGRAPYTRPADVRAAPPPRKAVEEVSVRELSRSTST